MITIFKIFENIKYIPFIREDIAICKDYTDTSYGIYLILENETYYERIKVLFIGTISQNFSNKIIASLIFHKEKNNIVTIKKSRLSHLDINQENLIYNLFNNKNYQSYINKIQEITNINIKESSNYKKWLIKKEIDKYNL